MTWSNRVVWLEGMFLRAQHASTAGSMASKRWCATGPPSLRPASRGRPRRRDQPQPARHRPVRAGQRRAVCSRTARRSPCPARPTSRCRSTCPKRRATPSSISCCRCGRRDRWKSPPTAPRKAATSSEPFEAYDTHSGSPQPAEVQVRQATAALHARDRESCGLSWHRPCPRGRGRRRTARWCSTISGSRRASACSAAPPLTGLLAELAGLLNQRGEALAARRTAPGSRGVADVSDFLLLQSVNRSREAAWRTGQATATSIRPISTPRWCRWRATSRPSPKRAAVPRTIRPIGMPTCSAASRRWLPTSRRSLSSVIEQTAIQIPLQQRAYGVRVGPIVDRGILRSSSFVLAVQADVPTETAAAAVPSTQVKIGAVEHYPRAGERRLAGNRGAAAARRAATAAVLCRRDLTSSWTAIRRTGRNCSPPVASPSISPASSQTSISSSWAIRG